MNALIFLALAAIAAPPPPAYPDKVTAQYYAGDLAHVPACAISTVGSAGPRSIWHAGNLPTPR